MPFIYDGIALDDIDEVIDDIRWDVSNRGFAVIGIGDGPEDRGRAYTIGLVKGRCHPELLIDGYPLHAAMELLEDFAGFIDVDMRIDRNPTIWVDNAVLGVVKIDESHLSGDLMAAWHYFYRSGPKVPLDAIQLVLPDSGCCYRHQRTQPFLGRLAKMCAGPKPAGRRRPCSEEESR